MRTLRKIVAVVAMTATFVGLVLVGGVNAAHYGQQNECLYGPGSDVACAIAMLNTSDFRLGETVEAMGKVQITTTDTVEIQFDWVHLYRNGVVVRQTGGPSGWLSDGEVYTTNWYDMCYDQHNDGNWQSRIRWRARWTNGATSVYEKTFSEVVYLRGC